MNIKKSHIFLILALLFVPAITNAAWWNPTTWFQKDEPVSAPRATENKSAEGTATTAEPEVVVEEKIIEKEVVKEVTDPALEQQIAAQQQTINQLRNQIRLLNEKLQSLSSDYTDVLERVTDQEGKQQSEKEEKEKLGELKSELVSLWTKYHNGIRKVNNEMEDYPKWEPSQDCHDGLKLLEKCRPELEEYRDKMSDHKKDLREEYEEIKKEEIGPIEDELKDMGYNPAINWYDGTVTFKDPRLEYIR